MSRFLSLLFYLGYKAGIIYASWQILTYFNMRFDFIVLVFYGFLSLFQLTFVMIQSLPKKKVAEHLGAIFQYTTVIIILMELIVVGMTVYYLFRLENDIFNLLFLVTALTPIHTLFYLLHSVAFSRVIRKLHTAVRRISSLPLLLFLAVSFGIPVAYPLIKVFLKTGLVQKDLTQDLLVSVFSIGFSLIAVFLIFAEKTIKARKIVSSLERFSIFQTAAGGIFTVDDPNEFGLVQSGINNLANQLVKEKENLSLLNDYISVNMKNETAKYGIVGKGETKIASVCTVRYSISDGNMTPENFFRVMNSLTGIIGAYADDYDAYPFFGTGRALLVFGAPFHYEQHKLNAIESGQKICSDLVKFGSDEGVSLKVCAGIYTGKVLTGALYTKGKNLKEYSVLGEGVEISERISAAAENAGVPLLVSEPTLDELKGNFRPEKSYKIRLKNGQDLAIHQIRI